MRRLLLSRRWISCNRGALNRIARASVSSVRGNDARAALGSLPTETGGGAIINTASVSGLGADAGLLPAVQPRLQWLTAPAAGTDPAEGWWCAGRP